MANPTAITAGRFSGIASNGLAMSRSKVQLRVMTRASKAWCLDWHLRAKWPCQANLDALGYPGRRWREQLDLVSRRRTPNIRSDRPGILRHEMIEVIDFEIKAGEK